MAYEIPLEVLTLKATTAMTDKRWLAVKLDTSGQVVLAGAGESAIGIIQDEPIAGEVGRVGTLGISFAVAGDAITAGSNVAADADGAFVTAGGGDAAIGVALISAAAGDIFSVLLTIKASAGTTGITAGYSWLAFPVTFSALDDVSIVTAITPGFTGTIDAISLVVNAATTDAATVNFIMTPNIGGVDLTGGVLTVSADVVLGDPDTIGKVIEATAITALNDVVAASEINLVVADTANAFTDGTGTVLVRMKVTA